MKRIMMTILVLSFAMLWMACDQTTQPTPPAQKDSPAKTSLLSPEAKAKIDAQLKDWQTKMPELLAKLKAQSKESPQQRQARVTSAVRAKAVEFKTRFQAQAQELSKDQGTQTTAANQIYVPDDYATIQDAVDAAAPEDEIIVRDGDYYEDVIVETDDLTLKAEHGLGSVNLYGIIEFGGVTGGKVDGFICFGDGGSSFFGYIFVAECTDVAVKNNAVVNGLGIIIYLSSNCNAKDNIAAFNIPVDFINLGGISVAGGSGNLVSGNFAVENGGSGILLLESYGNNVKSNLCVVNGTASSPWPYEYNNGILALGGGDNHYLNNEAGGNLFCGMLLVESDNNKIGPTNTFNENDVLGLYLAGSDDNVVQNNTAHDNGDTDMVDQGVGNQFTNNDFGTIYP